MTLNIFTSNLIIVIKRFVFCPCLLNLQSQSVFPKALIKNKYKMLLVLTVLSDQYSRRFLWPQAWRYDCCNTEMLFTVWTGCSLSSLPVYMSPLLLYNHYSPVSLSSSRTMSQRPADWRDTHWMLQDAIRSNTSISVAHVPIQSTNSVTPRTDNNLCIIFTYLYKNESGLVSTVLYTETNSKTLEGDATCTVFPVCLSWRQKLVLLSARALGRTMCSHWTWLL